MINLSLPMPPSTNSLYRNAPGRGRVKTERYKTWIRAAMNEAMPQRQKAIPGPYQMVILLSAESRRTNADATNRIKAPEDLLKRLGLITDDRYAESVAVSWCDKVPAKTCRVLVWPYTAERARIRATAPLDDTPEAEQFRRAAE